MRLLANCTSLFICLLVPNGLLGPVGLISAFYARKSQHFLFQSHSRPATNCTALGSAAGDISSVGIFEMDVT